MNPSCSCQSPRFSLVSRPPPLVIAPGVRSRRGEQEAPTWTRARIARARSSSSSDPTTPSLEDQHLDLELDTAGAVQSLRWALEPAAAGVILVVVASVAAGSEAEREGVVPGARLLALSDPIREGEVWEVGARPGATPSLGRIRDALRMRRSRTVRLVFETRRETAAAAAAAAAEAFLSLSAQTATPPPPAPSSSAESTLDDLLGTRDEEDGAEGRAPRRRAAAAAAAGGAAAAAAAGGAAGMTVGERMAAQQARQLAAERDLADRRARRRAYLGEQDARATGGGGGTRFLLGAAAAFVLPAAVILVWAWAAGLLDPARYLSLS